VGASALRRRKGKRDAKQQRETYRKEEEKRVNTRLQPIDVIVVEFLRNEREGEEEVGTS